VTQDVKELEARKLEQLGRDFLVQAARLRDLKTDRLLHLMERVHAERTHTQDLVRRMTESDSAIGELISFLQDQIAEDARSEREPCMHRSANCRTEPEAPSTSLSDT